ncbi:TonB-dependent receptor [Limibacter armeniacum]|uniref:TonB-dependent receptor n=1 Tax=Limibacter armeniacum TaxID=466084 RepID=UPI002FE688A2
MQKGFILTITLAVFTLFAIQAKAQQKYFTVSGRVLDKTTLESLPGAVIVIKGSESVSSTDQNGYYSVRVPAGEIVLHVHLLGYEDKIDGFTINKNLVRNYQIEPVSFQLQQVIVEDEHEHSLAEDALMAEQVNERFIARNMANTLAGTLEKKAGISSISTGVGISKPVIRGMSLSRILVIDGGIVQQDQQWGTDHGLAIDQLGVESMEVVKGAASLMYGSGGMGGVIRVKDPSLPEKEGFGASLTSFYRSNNQAIGTSLMGEYRTGDWFARVRGTWQQYGNYKVPSADFTYLETVRKLDDGVLVNTGGEEKNFSGTVGVEKKWGKVAAEISNFNQLVGLFPGAVGIPSQNWLDSFENDRKPSVPSQHVNHFKARLHATLPFSQNSDLNINLAFQENDRKEESDPRMHGRKLDENGFTEHGLILQTITSDVRYAFNKEKKWHHTVGVTFEHQQQDRNGFGFLLPKYEQLTGGIFYFTGYDIAEDLKLTGGVRYDFANIEVKEDYLETVILDNGEPWWRVRKFDRDFGAFSGALGVNWSVSDHWDVKLNGARTFRIPTVPELSINGVHHGTFRHERGDMNLSPEKGYQFDLSVNYQAPKLNVMVTPFFNYYENYIYLKPGLEFSNLPDAGQVYQHSEAEGMHAGFEAVVTYNILPQLKFHNASEYVYNYNMDTKLPFPFTPPFSNLTELEYTFRDVAWLKAPFLSTEYRITAEQSRVDLNEAKTPGYQLLNLSAGFNFEAGKSMGSLLFRVDNLADTQYMKHLSRYRILNLPEQGRNFIITFKYWL